MTFRTQLRPKDLSLEDKLFFTRLPFFEEVGLLIDVGCGPYAHVLKAAARPGLDTHALDPSPAGGNATWDQWLKAPKRIGLRDGGRTTALLFSSVIHELFSPDAHYDKPDPQQFWTDVARTGTEYAIIRDMCFQCDPRTMLAPSACGRLLSALEHSVWLARHRGLPAKLVDSIVYRVNRDIPRGIPTLTSQTLLREFIQVLLQSQWGEERVHVEMAEHYFALDAPAFDLAAQASGYVPIYLRHYTPEHLKQGNTKLAETLTQCPEANITTHFQAVYKKDALAGATGTIH